MYTFAKIILCDIIPKTKTETDNTFIGDKSHFESSKEDWPKVSVQGVVALGGHFAIFCQEVDFYEAKNYFLSVLLF